MRNLMIITLVLFSLNVHAERKWIAISEVNGARFYALDNPPVIEGRMVRQWVLVDAKMNTGSPISVMSVARFDCGQQRMKFLSGYVYDGAMGTGNNVGTPADQSDDWQYPMPDGAWGHVSEYVCSFLN